MKFLSFAGIDISKKDFDVALFDANGELLSTEKFPNDVQGFKKMISWKKKAGYGENTFFCLEHSGIYTLAICVFFEENNIPYSLQPGLQIKRSMGIRRGKNDKADAKMIGRYAYLHRNEVELYKLPSKIILELKQLLSSRERLVKFKVALQTSSSELAAYADKDLHLFVTKDSKKHIKEVNKSIREIDKKLLEFIYQDPELTRLYELLISVKGVGLQIAVNMLVITHGFTRFKNWRKFSCYSGLAPFEYRSGSSIRGKTKISHLGNKKIKALLGNGSASAIQHDPEIAKYYHRKLKEGKHKMLVKNAVKNKLVSRMFAVVKRGTPFVPLCQYA